MFMKLLLLNGFKRDLAIDITTHDVVALMSSLKRLPNKLQFTVTYPADLISYNIFEDDPVVLFVNTVLMEFLLWKSLLMLLLSLLR